MCSFSRNVAPGKYDVLFILIAWWLSQSTGLHAHSIISFRELLREPAVFVPGCFVELVDAADVFVGILPALPVKEMQQFSAWLSKQHGGSSFHFHYSKVLPELMLKQIWETSVFVK